MPLTPEGRESRSRHAKERRQWEAARGHQTGPRTPEGKAASALRALKHGARSAAAIEVQRWVASLNRLVRSVG